MAAIVAIALLAGAPAATAETAVSRAGLPGFRTRERPYLVSLVDRVRIKPLLTTGDVIGGIEGGYQMSGTPDGLGAYSRSNGTVELFMPTS
jgi:hypothetical protein